MKKHIIKNNLGVAQKDGYLTVLDMVIEDFNHLVKHHSGGKVEQMSNFPAVAEHKVEIIDSIVAELKSGEYHENRILSVDPESCNRNAINLLRIASSITDYQHVSGNSENLYNRIKNLLS